MQRYLRQLGGRPARRRWPRSRRDDLRRGVNTVGPHRDDLLLEIDGREARTHASQGEQRCLALALRLAVHELIRARTPLDPRRCSSTTSSPSSTRPAAGPWWRSSRRASRSSPRRRPLPEGIEVARLLPVQGLEARVTQRRRGDDGPRPVGDSMPRLLGRLGSAPHAGGHGGGVHSLGGARRAELAAHVRPLRVDGRDARGGAEHPAWATRARMDRADPGPVCGRLGETLLDRLEVVVERVAERHVAWRAPQTVQKCRIGARCSGRLVRSHRKARA